MSTLARSTRRATGSLRSALVSLTVIAGAALVWEMAARLYGSLFVSPLSDVLAHMRETWFTGPWTHAFVDQDLLDIVTPSLARLVPGFVIGAAAGVALGLAIGLMRTFREVVYPLVHFLRSIPASATIPLFIVLLGIGDAMKVWVVVVAVAFPVVLNTVEGVRSTEPLLLDACRVFGISRTRRVLQVVLPSASPQIFAGLRLGTMVALIVMVVVEMLAASDGIGYFVLFSQRSFRFLDMWSGLVLLAAFGVLLNLGLNLVERRALAWHRGARRTAPE